MSVTVTSTSPSCGEYNGSMLIAPSGGTAPYTYLVKQDGFPAPPLQHNGYFPNINAGVYHVTVTDITLLTVTKDIILPNINEPPSDDIVSIHLPTSCNSADGEVTLTGKGGTPPYYYSTDLINFQSSNVFCANGHHMEIRLVF